MLKFCPKGRISELLFTQNILSKVRVRPAPIKKLPQCKAIFLLRGVVKLIIDWFQGLDKYYRVPKLLEASEKIGIKRLSADWTNKW